MSIIQGPRVTSAKVSLVYKPVLFALCRLESTRQNKYISYSLYFIIDQQITPLHFYATQIIQHILNSSILANHNKEMDFIANREILKIFNVPLV